MRLIIKLINFLEDLTLLTLRIFPAELAKNITLRLLKLIYSLNLIGLFASSSFEKSKINIKKGLENTFNWYFENMKYYTTLKKKDITKRLGIIK